ncbi:hypothetical protein JCM17844_21240 [Iodidimonas gelatinilytica]|uniref:Uncharacterized protein n=1 Tax=Iodidimonas gelatinilytica TaxID=1236966 RepID=A0A5A7MRD0_9PROT|nr:nuclear transport factor 2 family protein [Iodidimonas gelatinilytica]GEQ98487.1 hypothetical protein JCM17844_21240 [Iodidimonas gelatinilytica]
MVFDVAWLGSKYPKERDGTAPYEYYVDIVTKRYFHGVDNKNLDLVLDCFHEDAFIHEMTSNTRHDGRDQAFAVCSKIFYQIMIVSGTEILCIQLILSDNPYALNSV